MEDGAEELKEFLRELPPESRPLFWKLFGRKLVGRHTLREELNTYVVLVKATAAAGSPLNRDVARDLARNLAALLKELKDEWRWHRHVKRVSEREMEIRKQRFEEVEQDALKVLGEKFLNENQIIWEE